MGMSRDVGAFTYADILGFSLPGDKVTDKLFPAPLEDDAPCVAELKAEVNP